MNFNTEQFTATQQANLNVASKELERQKQLFQKQYISQGALDRAQAQWEAARAQVQAQQAQTRAAQTQTGFFSVRAPFNGVVSDVAVTLGDMAMPGRPMLTLHDPSALRVSAAVPQSMLSGVRSQLASVRYEIAGHSAQPVTAMAPDNPVAFCSGVSTAPNGGAACAASISVSVTVTVRVPCTDPGAATVTAEV